MCKARRRSGRQVIVCELKIAAYDSLCANGRIRNSMRSTYRVVPRQDWAFAANEAAIAAPANASQPVRGIFAMTNDCDRSASQRGKHRFDRMNCDRSVVIDWCRVANLEESRW